MTETKSFIKSDQIDAEGKKVDDLYTITETSEISNTKTLSGTQIKAEIEQLEFLKSEQEKVLLNIQDEIKFLQEMIK